MDRTNVNKMTKPKVLAKAFNLIASCTHCPFKGFCDEECGVIWYKALTGWKNAELLNRFIDEITERYSIVDCIKEEF